MAHSSGLDAQPFGQEARELHPGMGDGHAVPVPQGHPQLAKRRKELCQQNPQPLKPLSTPAC